MRFNDATPVDRSKVAVKTIGIEMRKIAFFNLLPHFLHKIMYIFMPSSVLGIIQYLMIIQDGKEPFRKWCGLVGEIRSFLPKQVSFLALTATASPLTRDKIIKSLSLKKCLEISVSPNRENIKLLVLKVTSEISVNFTWLARELNEKNIECLRT